MKRRASLSWITHIIINSKRIIGSTGYLTRVQFPMKLINHLSCTNLVWFQERALWRTFLVLISFLRFSPQNYILLNKQRDIEHCLGKIKVLLLKFIFEFFIFNNTFNDISNILQYDKLFVLFHITWIIYCSVKQKPAQTITPSPPRTLLL